MNGIRTVTGSFIRRFPASGAVLLQLNLRISAEDRIYITKHSNATHFFVNETLLPLVGPIADRLDTIPKYYVITGKPFDQVSSKLDFAYGYEEMLAAEKPEFNWPMIDETSAYSACIVGAKLVFPGGV